MSNLAFQMNPVTLTALVRWPIGPSPDPKAMTIYGYSVSEEPWMPDNKVRFGGLTWNIDLTPEGVLEFYRSLDTYKLDAANKREESWADTLKMLPPFAPLETTDDLGNKARQVVVARVEGFVASTRHQLEEWNKAEVHGAEFFQYFVEEDLNDS